MSDSIQYLNRGSTSPMTHRLLDLIAESKQERAPVKQWTAWIAGLSQKGVKASEIKMSDLKGFLDGRSQTDMVTRGELMGHARRRMITLKEVGLQIPKFDQYRFAGGAYKEYLYVANSERDCVNDEIESALWDINDLNFNMEFLMEEPDLLTRLEDRLRLLRHMEKKVPDFAQHHYSEVLGGRNGKNLVAHARVTVRDDLYFLEEIQSDWAQKGRAKSNEQNADGSLKNLFETGGIPVGPYVTDTEEWAGVVLRRQAAIAAANPEVKRFGWITGSMRNGGNFNRDDGLNEFYTRIMPKIMDKVIGKVGGKVSMMTVRLNELPFSVPGFEMTDAVRARLMEKQPVFSRMRLGPQVAHSNELKCQVMRQCHEMLGSLAKVRIFDRCYDIHTGARVAGAYTNKILQLSEEAEDLSYTGNHETFHAAFDLMLNDHERDIVLAKFSPGQPLNFAVKDELIRTGNHGAAAQCELPEEAAAHGFALWREGRLDLSSDDGERGGIFRMFSDIKEAMSDLGQWIRKNVFDQGYQTPAEMFSAIENGALADRRNGQLREYYGRA